MNINIEGCEINNFVVKKASLLFGNHPKYGLYVDEAIKKIFELFPNNTELQDVLIKVTVLNTLYGTNIYDVFGIAKHIIKIKNLDIKIQNGDISAVNLIRVGHGIIIKKSQKERNFYSFSTKYCSFHNNTSYPIYDNLVDDLIFKINEKLKWINIKKVDMENYEIYKSLIDNFRKNFGNNMSYKDIDKSLWMIAKFIFRDRKYVGEAWINEKMIKIISNKKN